MTGGADADLEALLAQARAAFGAGLPGKVAALAALAGQGAWADLRRDAHKLRGSCGTYGLPVASALAGQIEDHLLEAGLSPGAETRARIQACIEQLSAAAALACGSPR